MESVEKIVEKYNCNPADLIAVLHDTQALFNYLPKNALVLISEKLKVPLPEVYRVATFYKAFSLKPRGKHHVRVCLGTACHVRGGERILDSVERALGIKSDEVTKDGLFSMVSVNCLGVCAAGPIMMIDKEYHSNMTPIRVEKILKKYR